MRSHGDESVSVDRSGEERPHAHSQTISGAGSAGCRMPMTNACGMPPRMSGNQRFTARVRRLFWWATDLSLAIGRICQICDRVTRRTEVAHYPGSRIERLSSLATQCNSGRMPDDRSTGQDRTRPRSIHARSYLRGTLQPRFQSSGRPMLQTCRRHVARPTPPSRYRGGRDPQPDRVCLVAVGHVHPLLSWSFAVRTRQRWFESDLFLPPTVHHQGAAVGVRLHA